MDGYPSGVAVLFLVETSVEQERSRHHYLIQWIADLIKNKKINSIRISKEKRMT